MKDCLKRVKLWDYGFFYFEVFEKKNFLDKEKMFHSIQRILEAKNLAISLTNPNELNKTVNNNLFPPVSSGISKPILEKEKIDSSQNVQIEHVPFMKMLNNINSTSSLPAILNNSTIAAVAFLSDPVAFTCNLILK